MPRFPITESECDTIVTLPKVIVQNVTWVQKPNKSWVTAKLPVESMSADFRGQLELIITLNVEMPSKFSITLLLNGAHTVRRLDIGGSHSNKCSDQQQWQGQTHKHVWSDLCPGGHAYTPTEITGNAVEDIFKSFCDECNIEFRGRFSPAPTQPQLPGI